MKRRAAIPAANTAEPRQESSKSGNRKRISGVETRGSLVSRFETRGTLVSGVETRGIPKAGKYGRRVQMWNNGVVEGGDQQQQAGQPKHPPSLRTAS
ncbi:hypothetical protein BDZ91DRAFT_799901 [Kalaharituber pfeilii]|nr:hypothetical protein BDZ91DRAFT_799901 [Kalaharituber pfeilii]